MKSNFDYKKLVPHFVAIGIFILISLIYFNPVLKGKVLNQSDVLMSKGMEKERMTYQKKEGKNIYWTNSTFGGMPTYVLGTGFPNDYTLKLHKAINFLPRPANFLFLYFISFYILMLVMRMDWKIAVLGSLAFGFSTYYLIIIGVGHLAKVRAIAYFPLVLAGILLVFERKKYFLGFILTTLALSLEINTKHYQMTYYLMFAVLFLGLFFLIEAYQKKEIKIFSKELLILLIAAFLGLSTNATNILPSKEYVKYSIRGENILNINPDGSKKEAKHGLSKDYITEYSYGIAETFNLLVPRFMGGSNSENLGEDSHLYKALIAKTDKRQAKDFVSSVSTYWGKQPIVAAPAYIGAITIFLAFLGLLFYKGIHKKWIVAAVIFTLLLSWGKNLSFLTDFFIDYVPMYNKFRAVSSIQVIVEFLLPILAVLGLYSFMKSDLSVEEKQKKLYIALGGLSGLLLVFILLGSAMFDFSGASDTLFAKYGFLDALIEDRKAMLRSDSIRSLLLILLAGGILWGYLKQKIESAVLVPALAVLILFDLAGVDRRYVNEDSFVNANYYNRFFRPTDADQEILKDKSYYRVMNLSRSPLTDGLTSYFHKQLGGYHAAKPRRMQDLFDFYMSGNIMPELLNMYNVKYLIVPNKDKQSVQLNGEANGNAWFVENLKFVKDENQEILELKEIDTKKTAVLNLKYKKDFQTAYKKDSLSRIMLKQYHPERLVYESENENDGFAVFSENFYKDGWFAVVDGIKTQIFKVDYALRGIHIPAGKHKIEFMFTPQVVKTGGKISLISFLLFAVFVAGGLFFHYKKQHN